MTEYQIAYRYTLGVVGCPDVKPYVVTWKEERYQYEPDGFFVISKEEVIVKV